jgi:hypothetical protein
MTTNTVKTTIDATMLATVKANKRQVQALCLALQDYVDNVAGMSDKQKEARNKASVRIGADVLKRKSTLTAKTPGELRSYVEGIKQRTQATQASLPASTWLLDHCTRKCVASECALVVLACESFVKEYEAARTDAEKKAVTDLQALNAKNATLQMSETRKVA